MKRVETGVVQFDDDWPGVFIRGDEALGLGTSLGLLDVGPSVLGQRLSAVVTLLLSCNVGRDPIVRLIEVESERDHADEMASFVRAAAREVRPEEADAYVRAYKRHEERRAAQAKRDPK